MKSLIEIWFQYTRKRSLFLKYVHLDIFKIYFGFPLLMSTAKTASYFLDLNTVNAKKKDRLLILDIKEIALAIMPNRSIQWLKQYYHKTSFSFTLYSALTGVLNP